MEKGDISTLARNLLISEAFHDVLPMQALNRPALVHLMVCSLQSSFSSTLGSSQDKR